MYATHAGLGLGYLLYLALGLLGKALLKKFVRCLLHQRESCLYDENAHDDGRYRVEHGPAFAKEYGSADAQRGAYGREGVAAVMPGVGHDGLRLRLTPHLDGESVAPLL